MYRIYKFSKDKSFGVYLKHLSIFFLGGFHSMRFTKGLNEYWRTLFVSPFGTDFRPTFVGAFLAWSWRIFFYRDIVWWIFARQLVFDIIAACCCYWEVNWRRPSRGERSGRPLHFLVFIGRFLYRDIVWWSFERQLEFDIMAAG